ncbi:MAG: heme lyase CcmF/NrfE family subunit [Jiangellaceae bacterium]
MTAFAGRASLMIGLLAAVIAAYSWLVAARRGTAGRDNGPARQLARLMTYGMLAAAAAGVAALEWALLTHDFSVQYVAENGNRAVPTYYTAISLWAALEGSLLLWLLVLTGLTVVVMLHPRRRGKRHGQGGDRGATLHPWALAVMAAVAAFFFALATFAGNAFAAVSPAPADGPGPNPLLQDHPLMGAHPPLLYLGYVGMTVPFAYAVAALVTGRTGGPWVALTRRWTLFAWTCLTLAILMGGWWSYEVLGWGGYWAWDPVENASIIPWFVATALLHSTMAQRRRATLRAWNLALALATFVLVLVGTFLTRSGVVQSVHSFTQSAVGPILLGFIVVVLVFSGVLLVWRSDRLGPDDGLGGGLSREAAFLGNNLVLVGLALTVLVGTMFPLLVEAVNGDRISVGAPYFNRMTVPLALAMIVLMGIGPLVPWGRTDLRQLGRRVAVPALVGLAVIGGLGLTGLGEPLALVTFGLAAFVLTTIAAQVAAGVNVARRSTGSWGRAALVALRRRRRFYGGMVVHAGVVMAAVAIAASQTYTVETEQRLEIGESVTVAGYTARLDAIERRQDARKVWVSAELFLSRDGTPLGTQGPALNFYPSTTQAIGTPAVHTSPTGDTYLVLVEADPDGRWAVISLSVHPLMAWLWTAGGVMGAGALIAAWPARPRRADREPAPEARDDHAEPVKVPQ